MPGVAESWEAAVEVTAAAYRVDPTILRAASRGRGPRPPKEAWDAKKMAIYIAVAVSGHCYAAVARALGLHKDTVCSHCASIRADCHDYEFEALTQGLTAEANQRLALAEKVLSISTKYRRRVESARAKISSDTGHSSDKTPDHENVIELSPKRVSA